MLHFQHDFVPTFCLPFSHREKVPGGRMREMRRTPKRRSDVAALFPHPALQRHLLPAGERTQNQFKTTFSAPLNESVPDITMRSPSLTPETISTALRLVAPTWIGLRSAMPSWTR